MTIDRDRLKRDAALAAVDYVKDGMIVGLGTGSTASFVVEALAGRVKQGLNIIGIPTSERTKSLAEQLDIRLASLAEHQIIDLTIDGADEVQQGTLDLIKGHGGALLREKIVAMASSQLLIAVDPRKLVTTLGSVFAVPVEVVPFGWETTMTRLRELGFAPELRKKDDGQPYVTDGHHYIVHCELSQSGLTAEQAADRLKATVGVVEHGLFLGMANRVVIGGPEGIQVLNAAR